MKITSLPEFSEPLAASLLEEARTKRRDSVDLALEVARARAAMNRIDEARALIHEVMAGADMDAPRCVVAADVLLGIQRADEAAALLRQCEPDALAEPANVATAVQTYLAAGDLDTAVRVAALAAQRHVDDPHVLEAQISVARSQEEHERTLRLCADLLARVPRRAAVRAQQRRSRLALDVAALSQSRSLTELIRRDVLEPATPEGEQPLAAALVAYLDTLEDWVWSPDQFSTRDGDQYRELVNSLSVRREPVRRLLEAITVAVGSFIAEAAPRDPAWFEHPDLRAHLTSWVVRLPTGGGHGVHLHPSGWISGVYCVQGDASASGTQFGVTGPDGVFHVARTEPVVPGEVVLFPSHLEHRVVPQEGEGVRICIAFDVELHAATD